MRGVIGLDIGGANTKARVARRRRAAHGVAPVRGLARPRRAERPSCARRGGARRWIGASLWRSPRPRSSRMRSGRSARASRSCSTRRRPRCRGRCSCSDQRASSVGLGEARARPLEVAAANWAASALAVAARHPDALVLDVGSTTADVIPVAAGRVAAAGRTDLDRLMAGELVYTGALRTDLARDRAVRSGARRLVPGRLGAVRDRRRRPPDPRAPRAGGLHVPDAGRPSSRPSRAPASGSRGWSAPTRSSSGPRDRRIAAHVHAEQVRAIEAAARQVGARFTGSAPPVVPLGVGAFLARSVAKRLGRSVVEMPWSADGARHGAGGGAGRARPPARVTACDRADRRQGRRRAGARGRRRDAAGAVRGARGGGRAASAARRARAAGRSPTRSATHDRRFGLVPRDRAPDGDPRDGPVRLGARGPHPRALRCVPTSPPRDRGVAVLLPAALLARARPAPRLLGRHLGLDRRVGRRRRGRRAARARQAGRGPLPRVAAGRRADRAS